MYYQVFFLITFIATWALSYPKFLAIISMKKMGMPYRKKVIAAIIISLLFAALIAGLGYIFFFPEVKG